MQEAVQVTVKSFGDGSRQVRVPPAGALLREVIRKTGVDPSRRRVAVNGKKAEGTTTVVDGDVVTLVPRVVGG